MISKNKKRIFNLIVILLVFINTLFFSQVDAKPIVEIKINFDGKTITSSDYLFFKLDAGRILISRELASEILKGVGKKYEFEISKKEPNTSSYLFKYQEGSNHLGEIQLILLRAFCEKNNFEIKWDEKSKTAFIDTNNEHIGINDYDKNLWQRTVSPYLKQDLWKHKESSDASEVLMLPLHVAFKYGELEWQNEFIEHFSRFMMRDNFSPMKESADMDLGREEYLYLASQFVKLAANEKRLDIIPPGLIEKLYEETRILWNEKPAWMWERQDFQGGMKERIEWKMNNPNIKPQYYHAFVDHELFLFAIAADLRSYENLTDTRKVNSELLDDILDTAYSVFQIAVVYDKDDTWLFQPGVWNEHSDYKYAGNLLKKSGIQPKIISDIAWDSSHFIRFPLWLTSLSDAHMNKEPEKLHYYGILKKGLEKQFYDKVLIKPSPEFKGYRTSNYMDGRNGLYRWQYITQGKDNGYGPYELSGTYILGWWAFLDSKRVRNSYSEMTEEFPLHDNVIKTYVGPNTTRERNQLVSWPNYFTNGFAELDVRLAGKLKE